MSVLLQNGVIFDPHSQFHQQKTHLLLEKGRIAAIGGSSSTHKTIDLKGAWICPGWVDMNAHFCDPGLEHKEDLQSGMKTAAAGGFTSVALLPNTNPVVETKSDVEYIRSKSGRPVDLLPYGALSEGTKGENMIEILDLHAAGAVAFTDGIHPIWNAELLVKVLQYLQKVNGLVISRPKDVHLARLSQMNEGKVSTQMGLRGEPVLSEKLSIGNQLEVLRYAGGRIHFSMISSAEGVRQIRQAKKEGLQVTCDVGVHHLRFTDEDLTSFDTRYKIDPPFRTEADRKALVKAVNDGTIDAIVTGHQPQDRESKYLEFDLAEPGITGLQTAFAVIQSIEGLDMDAAVRALTSRPRSILGLEPVCIEEGGAAVLSIFDPRAEWILDTNTNVSKSRNSPLWNKPLKGKALGIINKEIITLEV